MFCRGISFSEPGNSGLRYDYGQLCWSADINGHAILWEGPLDFLLPGFGDRGTRNTPITELEDAVYWLLTHIKVEHRRYFRIGRLELNSEELTSPDLESIRSAMDCEP